MPWMLQHDLGGTICESVNRLFYILVKPAIEVGTGHLAIN
jgi:hypothetical protein